MNDESDSERISKLEGAVARLEAEKALLQTLLQEAPDSPYGCACMTFRDGTVSKCWHCRVDAVLGDGGR